jgi:hypothetical protein
MTHHIKPFEPLPDITEGDLKYVQADFLVDGIDEPVFYISIIFQTEMKADFACKRYQELDLTSLEYPNRRAEPRKLVKIVPKRLGKSKENPVPFNFIHDWSVRTLLLTFLDPKLLIPIHALAKELGYESFMSTYHEQIRQSKLDERCELKNSTIILERSGTP